MTTMKTGYPRVVIVGLGGGWLLARLMAFFLSYYSTSTRLVLIDGNNYQSRQRDHESFEALGNKARVTAQVVAREFPTVACEAVAAVLGAEKGEHRVAVGDVLRSGDVVLLQVDNNRTKHIVEAWARTVPEITLISGGTAGDQLRVQAYLRREGRELTPAFGSYCHDIAEPTDELPQPPCPGLHQEPDDRRPSEVRHPFALLQMSMAIATTFYRVALLDGGGAAPFAFDVWHDVGRAMARAERVRVDRLNLSRADA